MPEEATTPAPCDRCGEESIAEIGTESLCGACFHEAGACCGRFGEED